MIVLARIVLRLLADLAGLVALLRPPGGEPMEISDMVHSPFPDARG